ncbi:MULTISPECIES: hypothetical protein [Caldimonas]|uniref:hypothetical protein n=1 Tax=Caldimonas TaxID=196013 RepID=UPI000784BB3B|nr:hypothetical protein [Caldimonas taiwanensis]MCX7659782.1 hypothetical protein [Caldimonas manganoxidans]
MRFRSAVSVAVLAVALAGCSSAPILNIEAAPVSTASGKKPSAQEVRAAIIRAGSSLGWQMRDEGPNLLVGTLHLRSHTAVVEIPYNSQTYSIKYRSSVNLDAQGGQIHKNYNGWIQNLNRNINAQLSAS